MDASAPDPPGCSSTAPSRRTGATAATGARIVLVLTMAASVLGCGPEETEARPRKDAPPFVPRAITDLRALALGDVHLRVTVDGVELPERLAVSGDSTTVSLPAERLGADGTSRIGVMFYLDEGAGIEHLLAEGVQDVGTSAETGSATLSGLSYTYPDTDADGLFDVHELAESRNDMDGDNLPPHEDADSDNDGLVDGVDPTPYGPTADGETVPTAEISVRRPDGTTATLLIDRIIDDAGETRTIGANGVTLETRTPPGWPRATLPAIPDTRRWSAFELDENGELCPPEWRRIPVDTSSLSSSLQGTALLYFRRGTEPEGSGFVAPLGADDIADLDTFEHTPPLDGDGPWNDALRVLLVPSGTVGWVRLREDANFTGTACEINLTTPSALG